MNWMLMQTRFKIIYSIRTCWECCYWDEIDLCVVLRCQRKCYSIEFDTFREKQITFISTPKLTVVFHQNRRRNSYVFHRNKEWKETWLCFALNAWINLIFRFYLKITINFVLLNTIEKYECSCSFVMDLIPISKNGNTVLIIVQMGFGKGISYLLLA